MPTSTVYNQKSYFLLVASGTTATYSPSNTRFSLKYFNIAHSKLLKTFLFQKYFYSNAKKIQIRQK